MGVAEDTAAVGTAGAGHTGEQAGDGEPGAAAGAAECGAIAARVEVGVVFDDDGGMETEAVGGLPPVPFAEDVDLEGSSAGGERWHWHGRYKCNPSLIMAGRRMGRGRYTSNALRCRCMRGRRIRS